MAQCAVVFRPLPRLKWRLWAPFIASLSCQFVLFIVHAAVQDAIAAAVGFFSFALGLSCLIRRRLAILVVNTAAQVLLFLVLVVCTVAGAVATKVWHEDWGHVALFAVQFITFACSIAISATLTYFTRRDARTLPVAASARKSSLELREHDILRTSSRHSLASNSGERGFLSSLRGLLSSTKSSICGSQHFSEGCGRSDSCISTSRTTASTRSTVSAGGDCVYEKSRCDGCSPPAVAERRGKWPSAQGSEVDADGLYHGVFGDFAGTPSLPVSCQTPSSTESHPDATCMQACALSSLAPCLSASALSGADLPSSDAQGDDGRDLHRASGESIVVFSATDDKGNLVVRTTSVSPVSSPKHSSGESAFLEHLPSSAAEAWTDAEGAAPSQAASAPAHGSTRFRVGPYLCEDYTSRGCGDGELPATFAVELAEAESCATNDRRLRRPDPSADQGDPPPAAMQDAFSPLKCAWKTLKLRSQKSMEHALTFLGRGAKTPATQVCSCAHVSSSASNRRNEPAGAREEYPVCERVTCSAPQEQEPPSRGRAVGATGTALRPGGILAKARAHRTTIQASSDSSATAAESPSAKCEANKPCRTRTEQSTGDFSSEWVRDVALRSGICVPERLPAQLAQGELAMHTLTSTSSSEDDEDLDAAPAEDDDALGRHGRAYAASGCSSKHAPCIVGRCYGEDRKRALRCGPVRNSAVVERRRSFSTCRLSGFQERPAQVRKTISSTAEVRPAAAAAAAEKERFNEPQMFMRYYYAMSASNGIFPELRPDEEVDQDVGTDQYPVVKTSA
ncbi:hypothetical protein BESB_055930 [Besnoitia besnoiti]|uniref:Transmembrane protein n=1 Tax=Besnoitia besnoiti TaxID=94643 RepID=A0A2A9MKK1_BESBE|nr:hypothetical protein BESB_055930 [Besnoitia besnoiti]PFH35942.1 hypothetical protein BESB_055930 [Besnoitia besnoiti]